MRSKDGTPLWVEITSRIIRDKGKPVGVHGTARDITDRKKAEEALRESEEKYRLVVENASEAIFVAQDGMIKFVNPKTLELIGDSEQELTSRPFTEFIHPDDRAMVVDRHERRIRGQHPPSVYAFRIIDKFGNIRWVRDQRGFHRLGGESRHAEFPRRHNHQAENGRGTCQGPKT